MIIKYLILFEVKIKDFRDEKNTIKIIVLNFPESFDIILHHFVVSLFLFRLSTIS